MEIVNAISINSNPKTIHHRSIKRSPVKHFSFKFNRESLNFTKKETEWLSDENQHMDIIQIPRIDEMNDRKETEEEDVEIL
jgi:hypothetical protein